MIENTAQKDLLPDTTSVAEDARTGGFRLTYYFTITSLIAFITVASALFILQSMEETFFAEVQQDQSAFFAQTQSEFLRRQETLARADMLMLHEASHVNLTQVISNTLRDADLAPFVAQAQQIPIDHCRALTPNKNAANTGASANARQTCFSETGRRIMSLPLFAKLDAKVHATMRKSSVFKIKVFDLRGITVYSSEHDQVGEDKADNRGWQSAVSGKSASELTHRDRFSAFEGVVENRDLISSYIPMQSGDDKLVGVFEIYSDVTPFLEQIKSASVKTADLATANQTLVERSASANQRKVNSNSDRFLGIVYGLLALLYIALLLLVRNGQRIINAQVLAQERTVRREEEWHREKMAALATMAANVAHEVGNPLTTITGLAEEMAAQQAINGCTVCQPKMILEQTQRIAQMTRYITDFASARRETSEFVDVNQITKAVCDFLEFDHRFQSRHIEFRGGKDLSACPVVPDHLNEALMNLLQMCLERGKEYSLVPGPLVVETAARGNDVVIRISCDPPAADDESAKAVFRSTHFESARRRVAGMRGQLLLTGSTVKMILPTALPDTAAP